MAITKVEAIQILDSRGNPTLETSVYTERGLSRAAVPSGASTGSHEAHELRDGGKALSGKGVRKAVASVNDTLGPALIKSGIDIKDQAAVDKLLCELDGTPNKSKLGANAILGVSLAVAKAAAAEKGIPLYAHIQSLCGSKMPYVTPIPFMNVLNGGAHAAGRLPFQEFMIAPIGFSSFSDALWAGDEVYVALGKIVKKKFGRVFIGDEGGFAPSIQTAEEALDMIVEAIEAAGYTGKVKIAMDCASSEFYRGDAKKYDLDYKNEDGSDSSKWLTSDQLGDLYKSWFKKYPFVSIEDPFAEDDWEAWTSFNTSSDYQVVGDDLTVTNPIFIKKAIETKACNALLLKVNQIGTLSESLKAAKDAQDGGWSVMVSHRSGETEDVTIADLSVGLRSGQIKSGAPARTDRVAKYNQLLRIEKEIQQQHGEKGVVYAGEHFRNVSKI